LISLPRIQLESRGELSKRLERRRFRKTFELGPAIACLVRRDPLPRGQDIHLLYEISILRSDIWLTSRNLQVFVHVMHYMMLINSHD